MGLETVTAAVENCRYCLMCRHNCPVGHVTRLETLTPHGWGLLIASEQRGLVQWNAETIDILYQCADCGNCRSHCVTDQPLPEAIAAARATIVAQGLAPSAVSQLSHHLQQWENPYQAQPPQPIQQQGEVALFVGDEAVYLWPSAVAAAVQLLQTAGVQPVLIGRGRNSGFLASSLGLQETAVSLAHNNLTELQNSAATLLLTLSPGDAFTFCQLYPERLGVSVMVPVQELTTWLVQQWEQGKVAFKTAEPPTRYTYVDPTHASRLPQRHNAPRTLLQAVYHSTPIELFFRQERTHPSGNTPLQFTNPALNKTLILSRLADAQQRGAGLLITEDPGTLYHLNQYAANLGLHLQGLYELLAQNLIR